MDAAAPADGKSGRRAAVKETAACTGCRASHRYPCPINMIAISDVRDSVNDDMRTLLRPTFARRAAPILSGYDHYLEPM